MVHPKGCTFYCKCFIKGKWYECDNYWVSEKFYKKTKNHTGSMTVAVPQNMKEKIKNKVDFLK